VPRKPTVKKPKTKKRPVQKAKYRIMKMAVLCRHARQPQKNNVKTIAVLLFRANSAVI
jgi:hypothetical protein